MRILICGDIHMNASQVEYLIRMAKEQGCEIILNVGDFGYWPHTDNGQKYLREVERMLSNENMTLYWVDGNHENFDVLFDPNVYSDSMLNEINNHFIYIPRGYVWEWDGVKFMGMGGAISIDRDRRKKEEAQKGKPHTFYWPQEAITDSDIARAIAAAQNGSQCLGEASPHQWEDDLCSVCGALPFVDVLLCHDAPGYVHIPLEKFNIPDKAFDTETQINRQNLNELVEAVRPKMIFHGHYHMRHQIPYSRPGLIIPCNGLACDGYAEDSWYVFDTENWQ